MSNDYTLPQGDLSELSRSKFEACLPEVTHLVCTLNDILYLRNWGEPVVFRGPASCRGAPILDIYAMSNRFTRATGTEDTPENLRQQMMIRRALRCTARVYKDASVKGFYPELPDRIVIHSLMIYTMLEAVYTARTRAGASRWLHEPGIFRLRVQSKSSLRPEETGIRASETSPMMFWPNPPFDASGKQVSIIQHGDAQTHFIDSTDTAYRDIIDAAYQAYLKDTHLGGAWAIPRNYRMPI